VASNRSSTRVRGPSALALAAALVLIGACGGGSGGEAPVASLTLGPLEPTATAGGPAIQFTANLENASGVISWALDPQLGTLSATTGSVVTYTPPASLAEQAAVTITASAGTLSVQTVIAIVPADTCGIPGAGWLAWSSRAAGNYDVVVGKADGTCARPISSDPANDLGATFSAATGRVAWSSFRSGMQRIVIYDLATQIETVLDLGDLSAANPAFSPDGAMLAFEGRVGSGNADIYIVSADGGTPDMVASTSYTSGASSGQPARDTGPAWLPPATPGAESTQLYFVSDRLAAHHVYRINLDATGLTQITTTNPSAPALSGILGKPSVSPDGSKVAFSRATASSGSRVVIRTLSTGAEAVLAPVDEAEPAFSADGATVAVMSYAYGNPDVVTRSAANGALVERVTTSPASEGAPAFAR
jgi:Tol biopolymer transport system component